MCIFFALSSYLILTILLVERESTGGVDLKRFYIRRTLRIWPLYFAALFFVYCWQRHAGTPYLPKKAVAACTFLVGNLYVIRHGWVLGPANALWSLSVEEQFYVLTALLTRMSRQMMVTSLCGATLVSYLVLVLLGHRGASPLVEVWPNSLVQFQFFALGGLLALFLYGRSVTFGNGARALLSVTGAAIWSFAAYLFPITGSDTVRPEKLLIGYFLVLLGTLGLFLSIIDIEVNFPPFLLYLGKISYGLYVFHVLFLWKIYYFPNQFMLRLKLDKSAIGLPVIFLLTVFSASVSYRFFERPILELKRKFETVKTRTA